MFTVQGNTPVLDANAYVSDTFVVDYHAARGKALTAGVELQQAIVRATDYIDQRFNFIGRPQSIDQETAWPRYDAINLHGYDVVGIPLAVKKAVAEYAAIAVEQELNPTPSRDESGRSLLSKSESVGPIEESVRYARSGALTMPSYPKADAFLAKAGLIAGSGRIQRG